MIDLRASAAAQAALRVFSTALGPHLDYLNGVAKQFNVEPAQMLATLVGLERQLREGAPEQRAFILASLIRDYPVDRDLLAAEIERLDEAAASQGPQRGLN